MEPIRISYKQLKPLLKRFYELKQPICLWGRPGSGKTSVIKEFGKEMAKLLKLNYSEDEFGKDYFTVKVITLSQFDSADLRGMPVVENGQTRFNPASCLPREGQGIIFLDEIDKTPRDVEAPAHQLALDRRIENLVLPEGFQIIAAGNRDEDLSNSFELAFSFLNRFCHFLIDVPIQDYLEYFLEQEFDERIIGYLKNFETDLFPKEFDERLLSSKAAPTPRSWEKASNLIKGINNITQIRFFVGSAVGSDLASKFVEFVKFQSKINIERLIKNPAEEIKSLAEMNEISVFYAMLGTLTSMWYRRDKKLTPNKAIEIASYLSPEFATQFLQLILKKRLAELRKVAGFESLLEKLEVYLPNDDEY